MKSGKSSRGNKFLHIITMPLRAFCKARDFYVTSMMNCANINYTGLHQASQVSGLPRSFSTTSAGSYDSEDYRELVRAASARVNIDRTDVYEEMRRRDGSDDGGAGRGRATMPPRSHSVAMGRIDEEKPISYFGNDLLLDGMSSNRVGLKKEKLVYPRSKSHAVARTAF